MKPWQHRVAVCAIPLLVLVTLATPGAQAQHLGSEVAASRLAAVGALFNPYVANSAERRSLAQPALEADYCERPARLLCASGRREAHLDHSGATFAAAGAIAAYKNTTRDYFQVRTAAVVGVLSDSARRDAEALFSAPVRSADLATCVSRLLWAASLTGADILEPPNRRGARRERHRTYEDTNFSDEQWRRATEHMGPPCPPIRQQLASGWLRSAGVISFRRDLDDHVHSVTYGSPLLARVREQLFPLVKALAVRVVRAHARATQAQLDDMLVRLENTSLGMCNPASHASLREAWYDRGASQVVLCPALLLTCRSDACIAYAIAHEFGHIFDPCGLSMPGYRPSMMHGDQDVVTQHPFGAGYGCLVQASPEGARTPAQRNICANRYLIESMADLFAAEVISLMLQDLAEDHRSPEAIARKRRFAANATYCAIALLEDEGWAVSFSGYPHRSRRAEITMFHTGIRRAMACRSLVLPASCGLSGEGGTAR